MSKKNFIAFNVISIILNLILTIVGFPNILVMSVLLLLVLVPVDLIRYQNHILKFPLNDLSEYLVNLNKDNFSVYNENDQCYYIYVNVNNGIYKTTGSEKELTFDMRGCIVPKTYIRAYFVRNINLYKINKKKLSLNYVLWGLKVDEKFKYKNLKIVFNLINKTKEYWLVKNGKTKSSIIISDIIGSPIVSTLYISRGEYNKYHKITENNYADLKSCYNYERSLFEKILSIIGIIIYYGFIIILTYAMSL